MNSVSSITDGGDDQDMARLARALRRLVPAPDEATVFRLVPAAARELVGADISALILRDGDQCHFVGEDSFAPVWHGQRLPAHSCIGGWETLTERELLIPDTAVTPLLAHDAGRPNLVRSLLVVPIRAPDPVGAIGVYWSRPGGPTRAHARLLQVLAEAAAAALTHARHGSALEQRLRERTAELERARSELHLHAITDELTGLNNRRGFYLLAEQALKHAQRRGVACLVAFLDADGLTHVNETLGHDAGDALLGDLAAVLRQTFRASDIIARMGGDEFCVLVLDPGDDAKVIRQRIQARLDMFNRRAGKAYTLSVSLGIVCSDPQDSEIALDTLLARADEVMFEEKRGKHASRVHTASHAA